MWTLHLLTTVFTTMFMRSDICLADNIIIPSKYYCGASKRNAAQMCIPCPSGSVVECTDLSYGCFAGVECEDLITSDTNSNSNFASELASNLVVTIDMQKNFEHNADCSAADWGLCHTQMLTLYYTGDKDYSNK